MVFCFSQLYNSSQLRFSTLKDKCEMGRDIDKMFSDAKQQFGNINLIINSETSLYQGFNNHLENLGNFESFNNEFLSISSYH